MFESMFRLCAAYHGGQGEQGVSIAISKVNVSPSFKMGLCAAVECLDVAWLDFNDCCTVGHGCWVVVQLEHRRSKIQKQGYTCLHHASFVPPRPRLQGCGSCQSQCEFV